MQQTLQAVCLLSAIATTAVHGQGYTDRPGAVATHPGCRYSGPFDLGSIATETVLLIGKPSIRCTEAARDRFESNEVCFTFVDATADTALFNYMKCIHPETDMHSFVYMGGQYVGDGFMFLSDHNDWRCSRAAIDGSGGRIDCLDDRSFNQHLAAVGAQTNCGRDCSHIVDTEVPSRFPAMFEQEIARYPVALFGWAGCPCTGSARNHFQHEEYCYMENVWADPTDKLFAYLQCRYGEQHHSFIFVDGQFLGNGFAFDTNNPRAQYGGNRGVPNGRFEALADAAGARRTCPFVGLQNLRGGDLQSCTQANDVRQTGWTRTGSCNWDARDGGYHEVCVEMSHDFLVSSAQNDGNDLSRVVTQGGHWCICAWAFASAVTRDPGTDHPQGITLLCDSTNAKLRDVYTHFATLRSPSGATYRSQVALALVERLCPLNTEEMNSEDIEETEGATEGSTGEREDQAVFGANGSGECYNLDQRSGTLTFPAWQHSCPNPHPLPAACPDACRAPFMAWWAQCREDTFVTGIDSSLGGDLTAFANLCKGH